MVVVDIRLHGRSSVPAPPQVAVGDACPLCGHPDGNHQKVTGCQIRVRPRGPGSVLMDGHVKPAHNCNCMAHRRRSGRWSNKVWLPGETGP